VKLFLLLLLFSTQVVYAQSSDTLAITNMQQRPAEFNYVDSFGFGHRLPVAAGSTMRLVLSSPVYLINTESDKRLYFWVHPGEQLIVTQSSKGSVFLHTKEGNGQRDMELRFFSELADSLGIADRTDIVKDPILSEKKLPIRYRKIELALERQLLFLQRYALRHHFEASITGLYEQTLRDIAIINHLDSYTRPAIPISVFYKEYSRYIPSWKHYFSSDSCTVRLSYRMAAGHFAGLLSKMANPAFSQLYDVVKQNFSDRTRDFLLSRVLLYKLKVEGDIAGVVTMQRRYISDCVSPDYKMEVTKQIAIQQKLSSLAAHGDRLLTPRGDTILLADLLAQHRVRKLYIDCWASWCAPCLTEMPNSIALQELCKGKPVDFIYLSFDEDAENWQRALLQGNVPATNNYLLLGGFATSFARLHRIQSLPRYLIFSESSRLLNSQAPRPGDVRVKRYLLGGK
jgi:thiol-disulfide isomerase/thioredoxin